MFTTSLGEVHVPCLQPMKANWSCIAAHYLSCFDYSCTCTFHAHVHTILQSLNHIPYNASSAPRDTLHKGGKKRSESEWVYYVNVYIVHINNLQLHVRNGQEVFSALGYS